MTVVTQAFNHSTREVKGPTTAELHNTPWITYSRQKVSKLATFSPNLIICMVPHSPPKLSFFSKSRDFLEVHFLIRVSLVTQAGLGTPHTSVLCRTAFQAVLPPSSPTASLQCDFSWTCCHCFYRRRNRVSWDHHLNMQPLFTR